MLDDNPDNDCECDVTGAVFNVVDNPYEVVVPYSTCESDASFVAHVIVALLDVADADTPLITGGVVSGTPLNSYAPLSRTPSAPLVLPSGSILYCVPMLESPALVAAMR